jgi:hypothetical protein
MSGVEEEESIVLFLLSLPLLSLPLSFPSGVCPLAMVVEELAASPPSFSVGE